MSGLAAAAWLAVVVVPVAGVAHAGRRRLVDAWTGPVGLLGDLVVTLTLVVVLAELAGSFGGLRRPVLLAAAGAAGAAWWAVRRTGRPIGDPRARTPPTPAATRTGAVLATLAACAALVRWVGTVLRVYDEGLVEHDTLHYHLGFAATFARTGHTGDVLRLWLEPTHAFHPATAELLQAVTMVLTGTDRLVPVFNLAWAVVFLLACWCVTSRAGSGWLGVAIGALVIGVPVLSSTNAGAATTDVAALALATAALALALHAAPRLPAGLWVAGAAAGLAVGTKLTAGPLVAVTLVVAVVQSAPRDRLRAAGRFVAAALVAGGYWFARNVVRFGSPVPAVDVPGLDRPATPVLDRLGSAIADYLGDAEVVRTVFLPGWRDALGPGLPGVAALAAVVLAVAVLRRPRPAVAWPWKVLLLGSLVCVGAYLATPLTAWGLPGEPLRFFVYVNTRYVLGALLLALLATAGLVAADRRATRVACAGLLAGAVWQAVEPGPTPVADDGYRLEALALVALVVAAGAACARLRPTRALAAGGALAVVGAAAVIAVGGRHIPLDAPFVRWPEAAGLAEAEDVEVGFVLYNHLYPFAGRGWSNRVEAVVEETANGGFLQPASCPSYVRAVNAGGFEVLVVGSSALEGIDRPFEAWTRAQPTAEPLRTSEHVLVVAVRGPFDPAACE